MDYEYKINYQILNFYFMLTTYEKPTRYLLFLVNIKYHYNLIFIWGLYRCFFFNYSFE